MVERVVQIPEMSDGAAVIVGDVIGREKWSDVTSVDAIVGDVGLEMKPTISPVDGIAIDVGLRTKPTVSSVNAIVSDVEIGMRFDIPSLLAVSERKMMFGVRVSPDGTRRPTPWIAREA
jgi:hypothetical protein